MAGIKSSPTCLGATVVIIFLVIFFGVWAAEEAFHKNHSDTMHQPDTTHKSAETISPCNQGLPKYLHLKRRSLVSRLSRWLSGASFEDRCAKKETLLRQKPFLMSHDAATGYSEEKLYRLAPKSDVEGGGWTMFLKTQDMDFAGQLNCGARALDLRMGFPTEEAKKEGNVYFHHGLYVANINSIEEVVTWAKKNPEELVILMLSHCKDPVQNFPLGNPADTGDDKKCDENYFKAFEKRNIHVVRTEGKDKDLLKTMTVEQAEKLAQKEGVRAGKILAIHATEDAVNPNFDETVIAELEGGWHYTTKAEWAAGLAIASTSKMPGLVVAIKKNGGYPAPYYKDGCLPDSFNDKCSSCKCLKNANKGCILDANPEFSKAEDAQTSVMGVNQFISSDGKGLGSSMKSPNGDVELAVQGDGNLVVYVKGQDKFITNTKKGEESGPYSLTLQGDGNLVLTTNNGEHVWSSGTVGGRKAATLQVQNDGNVVLLDNEKHDVWSTGTSNDNPSAGGHVSYMLASAENWRGSYMNSDGKGAKARLLPGIDVGSSMKSPNGLVELRVQGDGNLVVYGKGKSIWALSAGQSSNKGPYILRLQGDGNLLMLDNDGVRTWGPEIPGTGGVRLQVQNDGNVVLYAKDGKMVWATASRVTYGGGCVPTKYVGENAAWMALWKYCKDTLKNMAVTTDDKPWQLQGIWQTAMQPFKATVLTRINYQIMLRMINPEWSKEWDKIYPDSSFNKVNFLLLNAVQCAGPLIGEHFGAKSKDKCSAQCKYEGYTGEVCDPNGSLLC